MATNQNDTEEKLANELNDLVNEIKEVNSNIDIISKESSDEMNNIEKDVDRTSKSIEDDLSEIEDKESKAESDIDELIIKRAEELAEE